MELGPGGNMIKFALLQDKSKIVIGLGITRKNVELLKEGKPILVKLQELGIVEPIEVMIFYGETEEIIAKRIVKTFSITETMIYAAQKGNKN